MSMPSRQRLTFQLTPLLDLLLIVIFAQYMEVRESSAKTETEAAQAKSQIAEAESALERIRNDRQLVDEALERRVDELTEELERQQLQKKEVAELIAAMFKIPDEVVDRVLQQQNRSPAEQEQLRKQLKQLASERTNEALKHLLTHRAMRKRVDVWEIGIDGNGVAQLNSGGEKREFRFRSTPAAEAAQLRGLTIGEKIQALSNLEDRAANQFADQLFDAYKTLPQPKDIVVVLFSWKPDTDRHWRKPGLTGLERALRLMHGNTGRVQFVPAVLGLEVEQ